MPKIVDHEQRREELADAVLRVIAKGGTTAVTNKAVAKETGRSTGILSHYFGSQRELLVAALRRAATLQGQVLKRLSSAPADSEIERLQRILESVLPLDAERLALNRVFLCFYSDAVADDETRVEVAGYLANWRRFVRRVVVAAQAEGSLPATDPDVLTVHLVGLADGVALHCMMDPDLPGVLGTDHSLVPSWLAATWAVGIAPTS